MPEHLRAHESVCSFCLTPKEKTEHLVAGPHASICDACIRRYRPPGLVAWLRALVFGRSPRRRPIATTPYRTVPMGCSFCEDTQHETVAGAQARICDTCLDLAAAVLFAPKSAGGTR